MRIGLFLNNLDEEYQISVFRGVRYEAAKMDMELICIQGETLYGYRERREKEEFFPSREFTFADGVLILSSVIMSRTDLPLLPEIRRFFDVPLVSISRRITDFSGGKTAVSGTSSIIVKNRESMSRLMEHLIVFHGYRKLLYLGGPVQHLDNLVREHVFRRTINTLKKEYSSLEGRVINGEFHQTSAIMMLREYISSCPGDPPDVIVAANDNMAMGVMELLRTFTDPLWRSCPVTGFDDIDQARLEVPALTTIRQPLEDLGRLAVRTLSDLIAGREVPLEIFAESQLRIRNSCGCGEAWETGKETSGEDYGGSEYPLQNISYLGQTLAIINSMNELFFPLNFFLTNLAVKSFYLILYPQPLDRPGKTGNLIFSKTHVRDYSPPYRSQTLEMKVFFSSFLSASKAAGGAAWCVCYLRSGREYLGLIVYEAPDRFHAQMCSAAVFLANTIKRLQILEDEKEQSQRLEREVALRTRDLSETYEKLREETRRRTEVEAEVLRISEMERLRFSMDLHDDICQRLAGISMFCKSLSQSANPGVFLSELSQLIDETLARTRRYAHDSFPMELDALGLKEALDALCHTVKRQSACNCRFSWFAPEKSPFGPAGDLNIYRIVQEALHNAVKHAGAAVIDVHIQTGNGVFSVSIQDNGVGDPRLNEEKPHTADIKRYIKSGSLGLRSMRYRAHQLGGRCVIESSQRDGTRVEIRIPMP